MDAGASDGGDYVALETPDGALGSLLPRVGRGSGESESGAGAGQGSESSHEGVGTDGPSMLIPSYLNPLKAKHKISGRIPELALLRAATLVDDAKYSLSWRHSLEHSRLVLYRVFVSKPMQVFLRCVCYLNLALAFVELPSATAIPPGLALAIELATLLVFTAELAVVARFIEEPIYRDKKNWFMVLALSLTGVDILMFLIWGTFRWSRVLRPFFLVYNGKYLRLALRDIRKTLPDILSVLTLLFTFLIIYSIFVTILYGEDERFAEFGDLWRSFTSMYVLRTTANFPDVMMPMYNENRLNALVFIVYLIVSVYLLTSFILAVVYNKYRLFMKEEERKAIYRQHDKLTAAFEFLDVHALGHITEGGWNDLMAVLRPHYPVGKVALLWDVIRRDTDTIDVSAFRHIVELLNMKVEGKPVKRRRTCCTCCEGLACARHVTRVVQHPVFNVVVDFLIVVNVVVLAIDTWFGSDVFLVSGTEVVFVLVFGIEVSLRVTAAGVRAYFREWTNVLDFAVVLATTLDLLLTLTPINTPDLYRFLLLLRTLRLWTTVNRIKRFRVILSSLVQLTPALATYASVQVMLFYVFAIVGMASFDGLIYEGNPALNGTTFAAPPSYAANNFNDFFSSLVTLTELMIVNQWHVIVEGYVAATGTQATWIFFILFNFSSTLIILNIVVAFILEVFVIQWELNESGGKTSLERRIEAAGRTLVREHYDPEADIVWTARPKQGVRYFLAKMFMKELEAELRETELFHGLDDEDRVSVSGDSRVLNRLSHDNPAAVVHGGTSGSVSQPSTRS